MVQLKPSILKNPTLDDRFQRDGYVALPLPGDEIVSSLRIIYEEYKDVHRAEGINAFHATQDAKNPELARRVDEKTKDCLRDLVATHFHNYRIVLGAFLIKEPGNDSVHPLHQDWNFTDESRFFSCNIWIPLDDVNRANGCLRFLPGSHHIAPSIRPNFRFDWAFRDVAGECADYLVDVPVNKGQCVVLNHAVVHSSWPNTSDKQRVVAILTLVPQEAELLHYFSEDGKAVEEYSITVEDIYSMSLGKRPDAGKLKNTFPLPSPYISPEMFSRWIFSRLPAAPVLADELQNRFLTQQGYGVLPLFPQPVIAALTALFQETLAGQQLSGFYANHNRGEQEVSQYISSQIRSITEEYIEKMFPGFEQYVAHFVVKSPETAYTFSLHQDWNILEEWEEKSFQLWIPLSAVDKQNGGLFVLPGSHAFFRNYRSGSYGIPLVKGNEQLEAFVVDLTVPPGHAVAFQNNLFHGSHPNKTTETRASVLINIIPKNSNPFLAHQEKHTTTYYRLTETDLLQNLQSLEKGLIPEGILRLGTGGLSAVKNEAIDAQKLFEKRTFHRHIIEDNPYNIIRNKNAGQELNEKGYTVLPFLSETEINRLRQIYDQIDTSSSAGRYTSLEHASEEQRLFTRDELWKVIQPKWDSLFTNYKLPILQFFVKKKNSSGDIDFHTDTSLILNQAIEPNYGIWIPLIDVTEENGAMIVVPGSHQWYDGIIAGPWPFYPYLEQIRKKSRALSMNAGDMLVFDTRLIHSSAHNQSSADRISIVARAVNRLSRLYSFEWQETSGKIRLYQEKDDFYYSKNRKTDGAGSFEREWVGELQPHPIAEQIIRMLNE